jgi:alkylhydroperoxidase family enzyme
MAYIEQTEVPAARGLLKKIYQDAITRAGKVWNIVRLTSINPRITRAHLGFYGSVMKRDSSLEPRLRETLAIVVSRANDCFY